MHLIPRMLLGQAFRTGQESVAAGIDLNTALQELGSEIPAPIVAEMLGYSHQVTQKHATESGNTWGKYAHTRSRRVEAVHDDPV